MKRLAAIALGSNLASPWGDREANLREAVARVAKLGTVRGVSSFYDTEPVGTTDQPNFMLGIERAMGRDRASVQSKGPRIIDLDLLLMDDVVLVTDELTLPHPAMAERRFVLEPLAEIAPAMVDPLSGRAVAELLARLNQP
jgi:2-amino-4-hydroxy-6-hydroxymethyldihydropteridine diphosphokinase